jgi:hypothetical protein
VNTGTKTAANRYRQARSLAKALDDHELIAIAGAGNRREDAGDLLALDLTEGFCSRIEEYSC